MTNEKVFIAIAGNIGAGKTTLTQLLSERFGWAPHFEAVQDNPYLADFYSDMKRWSFPLQIYFLSNRFEAHKKVIEGSQSAVQDRSVYEDANIFARNLYEQGMMEERDYQNYLELYNIMIRHLSPPELVIYLKKSLPGLKRRIASRGREFEKNIPESYLSNLNRYYDEWLQNYDFGKKLIIESDDLDFLENENDFNYLTQSILDALDQRDIYLESKVTSSGLKQGSAQSSRKNILC